MGCSSATVLLFAALLGAALPSACGGAERPPASPASLPTETRAALAGHRCLSPSHCQCRRLGVAADQAERTPPPAGKKRFEVRVQSSTGVVWVTIDGKEQLFKSTERAEDCFYVDLAPGPHPIRLWAKADAAGGGGVGVGLRIAEHEPGRTWWFTSFDFQCGVPGPCDKDRLTEWKAEIAADRRRLRDPCGMSRIQGLTWETGRMPDALHPQELRMSFTLNVYARVPERPPGDPDCAEL